MSEQPPQGPPQQPPYPQQPYPQQPYPPQGYPPQQPYPPQGYPPQQQPYPPQGYPPQQGGYYPPQGPPQGGYYPPQGPPPQQPPAPPSNSGGDDNGGGGAVGKIVGGIVALALIGAAVVLVPKFLDKNEPVSATSAVADENPGEIFLESASDPGQDPFSEDPLAEQPKNATPVDSSATVPTGNPPAVRANEGGTVGLYGGTMNEYACNPEKQIRFLEANPDKAAAFVAALNSDPTLDWQGDLQVSDIRAYFATLTSVELNADTRVTNHGFKDGKPYAFQSILQKGTSALVDQRGVFRVRCWCGNPLAAPKAVKGTPKYTGAVWKGFDPAKVRVVTPSPTKLTTITVIDPNTGATITRTAGGAGQGKDVKKGGGKPTTTTPTTTPKPNSQTKSQGVTYDYNKPGGWQVNVGTSSLAKGATKIDFAPNIAAYQKNSSGGSPFTNNPGIGFGIVDLTGRMSNQAYLAGRSGLSGYPSEYQRQFQRCMKRNVPLTIGGFTGVYTQIGPCPAVGKLPAFSGTDITFVGTRADGTRVGVPMVSRNGQILPQLAGTLASFKRK